LDRVLRQWVKSSKLMAESSAAVWSYNRLIGIVMNEGSAYLDSPAVKEYVARLKAEVSEVVEKTHSLSKCLDIGDSDLRRSLHLEATALACHWVQAFSEATPEMLSWAKIFSRQLMQDSEASSAYGQVGFPAEAPRFFANRLEYYRENKASWQLDENLLNAWIGMVNFSTLFRSMKVPAMIGKNQEAEHLLSHKGDDLAALRTSLGIDPHSQEYFDLMGDWLKGFAEMLAKVVAGSNRAFVAAMVAAKKEGETAVKTVRSYKAICLVLGAWCSVLPFLHLDQIWVFQLTRIAVTVGMGFLAIVLRGWQMVAAIVFAVLFNPILPIDFDKKAWLVVHLAAATFLLIVAFWPKAHSRIAEA